MPVTALPPETASRLLASIGDAIEIINQPRRSLQRRLDQVLAVLLGYLEVEQGSIMLRAGRRYLVVRAASRKEIVGLRQPLDQPSLAAEAVRSGEAQLVADISRDPRFPARDPGGRYRSKTALAVPIRRGRRVLGVINITDKTGGRDLMQEDAAFLLEFSSFLVAILQQEEMARTLSQQRAALKRRNQELQRAQAMQNDLARMLLHDIKGPLAEAIANLDVLSYAVTDPESRQLVHGAQTACDKAVRMASDLGQVARLEDGNLTLLPEPVLPAALIEDATLNVAGIARARGITLAQEVAPDLPEIRVDRRLLDRVLQNLLVNAMEHAPGSTTVTVGCTPVAAQHRLRFFVRDQGPGIDPALQATIFDKYARLTHRTSTLAGSGLGLYFCRLAVEAHGGEIGVDSRPGLGATFFFHVPAGNA